MNPSTPRRTPCRTQALSTLCQAGLRRQAQYAFIPPADREVRGIPIVLWSVPQAPEMAAIEPDLSDIRPGVLDELQVARVPILGPVGDEPGEFEARWIGRFAPWDNPEGHGQDTK